MMNPLFYVRCNQASSYNVFVCLYCKVSNDTLYSFDFDLKLTQVNEVHYSLPENSNIILCCLMK